MADLSQKQVRDQGPPVSGRPPRSIFSADQQAYVDQLERVQRLAVDDPTLNGQDARDRYEQGANQ
jgi:hypothetical protein